MNEELRAENERLKAELAEATEVSTRYATIALHQQERLLAFEAEVAALREDRERLKNALEEIAEGDGCNCRVGPGCDWKCKDIAREAIDAARKEHGR